MPIAGGPSGRDYRCGATAEMPQWLSRYILIVIAFLLCDWRGVHVQRWSLPALDSTMSFLADGSGPLVMLLHGNPTSSHLWRNVIPNLAGLGYHVIAVDLIGMGLSGPSRRGYRLLDHLAYLEAFVDTLGAPELVLVGHDWGGVLALALARSRRESVRGVAVLEAHLHPIASWSDMSEADREMFSRLRAHGSGEQAIIGENFFVEVVLPSGIVRRLGTTEHDGYRAPFSNAESRAPILQWVREIPIGGRPADVAQTIVQNQEVLQDADLPTLLLYGTPGALVGQAEVQWCATHGRAMTLASIGEGTHFLPEDRPGDIVKALVVWLRTLKPLEIGTSTTKAKPWRA